MSKTQKSRPRLGRGLSSLISISDLPVEVEVDAAEASATAEPSAEASMPRHNRMLADEADTSALADSLASPAAPINSPPQSGAIELDIDSIVANPHQPRKQFNDASLAELAASIKSTGLIQPIIVRPSTRDKGTYELIAGERRLRAARLAGLAHVLALVRDVDSFAQAQMALVENIQREDLNPIDRAQGYRTLIEQLGLTQAELAARVGEDRSTIANFLRMLDLPEAVQQGVRQADLSLGHAKLLAGVADSTEQIRLAQLVHSQQLSVRNLERLLQEGPKAASTHPGAAPSPHIADLEKNLARQLGMPVQVRSKAKGKGRVIIHYGSLDQFDDLLARLSISAE